MTEMGLPHFDKVMELVLSPLAHDALDAERRQTVTEIALREYADALEQSGLIDKVREVASRASSQNLLWVSKWQRPYFMLSGLRAEPFWTLSEKWMHELEQSTPVFTGIPQVVNLKEYGQ